MTTDEQRLVVQFEASTRKMERQLARVEKKLGRTAGDIQRNFERSNKGVQKSVDGLVGSLGKIGGASIALAGVAAGLRQIALAGDEVAKIEGRFEALTDSAERASVLVDGLFDVVSQTGGEIAGTADALTAFRLAADSFGAADDEVIRFTSNIQKLGVIGGASAQDISRGIRQLGQGLTSGVLRAEEFNSILENTPFVAKAIADAMGVTVGQLRQAVLEGRVLAEDVFANINAQSSSIQENFEKIPSTVDRATNRLAGALTRVKAQLDENLGVSTAWAGVLNAVAGQLERSAEAQEKISRLSQRVEVAPGRSELAENVEAQNQSPTRDGTGFDLLDPRGDDLARGRVNPFSLQMSSDEARALRERLRQRRDVEREFEGLEVPVSVNFDDALLNSDAQKAIKDQVNSEFEGVVDTGLSVDAQKLRNEVNSIFQGVEIPSTATEGFEDIYTQTSNTADKALEVEETIARIGSSGSGITTEVDDLLDSLANVKDVSADVAQTLASGINQAVIYGRDLSDVLGRVVQKIAGSALEGFLSSAFSGTAPTGLAGVLSGAFGGFRANGGPVSPSKGYVVGENGPEFFQPRVPGQILNSSQMQSGGATINLTVNAQGSNDPAGVKSAVESAIPQMAAIARRVVADERRRA